LALNPALDMSQYAHKSWLVSEGFFKGEPRAIAQTPDGYLWLGTEFGLFRFDGIRRVPFEPTGVQLPSNNVRHLAVSRDGTLWIGTFKGLASWKGGVFTRYAEFAGNQVSTLFEDREGTLWVGTLGAPAGKLCGIRAGAVQCDADASRLGVGVLAISEYGGSIWVNAMTGLWRWTPGSPQLYWTQPIGQGRALIEGDNGHLWIGTSEGIKQLKGEKMEAYPSPTKGLFRPNRFHRDREGSLWIGTSRQGLWHSHQGHTDHLAVSDGLSGDYIQDLFEDREGSIWVVTSAGLDRFHDLAVSTISFRQGLSDVSVAAVLASSDGSVWLGTTDGLNRWLNGQITIYRKRNPRGSTAARTQTESLPVREIADNGLPDDVVGSLFEDRQGRIWVSTLRGTAYFENERFVPVTPGFGKAVHSIVQDTDDTIWINEQYQGLLHLSQGKLVDQIPPEKLKPGDFAVTLAVDHSPGGLWIGFFNEGLAYFKDGRIQKSYTSKDGLPEGRVNDLRLDSQGTLWLSTESGLSRFRNGRFTTMTAGNGLPCDSVHWMMEDDAGFLWVYTACGLVRFPRSELELWSTDPKHVLQALTFDGSDGVGSLTLPSGYSPRAGKTPDGRLWFAGLDGVNVVDPRHLTSNKLPPPVQIETITADRKIQWQNWAGSAASNLRLPPLTRDLIIEYTALSLVAPGKVRFRYKLEGRDRNWRDDTENHRQAVYNDLPPRPYRFRVQASNNSGVWNEAGASLDFSVAPMLYQARWFQALSLAAFVTALALLYQWRVRYLARQFGILTEARVDERMRIARDLHDTLLQSFQGLLLKFYSVTYDLPDRPTEAQKTLESAIEQARNAITEGRDAIQGLRSCAITNDLAQAMTVLGEEVGSHLNGDHSPEFLVQVEGAPRDLAPLLHDDVYRIAGEALRNAFRHSYARRIEIEIRYDERQLRLRVRDNGKGIDPKFLGAGGREGHFGLASMHERAKLLGGKLAVWSELDSGTEVELTVPASMAYARTTAARWSLFRKKDPVVHE
jgi:signal transduction histidine kinase/ligand-binding sensor domain-containing protein